MACDEGLRLLFGRWRVAAARRRRWHLSSLEDVTWSPLTDLLAEGECHGPVGDCLFACLAVWLRGATGYGRWIPPSTMRCLAVAELTSCQLEPVTLLYDLGMTEGHSPEESIESVDDLQRLMLDRHALWANETFLRLWLGAVTRRLLTRVAAIVKTADGYVVLTHDQDQSFDVAVALHHVNGDHYRLLAPLEDREKLLFLSGGCWTEGPITRATVSAV
jgi:hypothetical protein